MAEKTLQGLGHAMQDPPVEIDAEIRGLTYLVSKLGRQASSASPISPKDDAHLTVVTHIATLDP